MHLMKSNCTYRIHMYSFFILEIFICTVVIEKLIDEHFNKLSENQKTWLLERKEILNPSKKNKNFIAG